MDIKISKMTAKYTKEVSDLGFKIKEFQYNPKENTTYSEIDIKRAIKSKDAVCLMAIIDNKLAGFAIRTYHPFFKEGYLNELYVKKEYRKNGIGQMLFDKSMEILNKKGMAWTWSLVQEENKIMQFFLEKNGFKKGKKFYFYYKD